MPEKDTQETREFNDPWKHRSNKMRCFTCMWFALKAPENPPKYDLDLERIIGRCRRHCPTMGGFPAVFSNDWCGDHKIDENKI